jgi:hypothetical protein
VIFYGKRQLGNGNIVQRLRGYKDFRGHATVNRHRYREPKNPKGTTDAEDSSASRDGEEGFEFSRENNVAPESVSCQGIMCGSKKRSLLTEGAVGAGASSGEELPVGAVDAVDRCGTSDRGGVEACLDDTPSPTLT